jgi:hypothetical protein
MGYVLGKPKSTDLDRIQGVFSSRRELIKKGHKKADPVGSAFFELNQY